MNIYMFIIPLMILGIIIYALYQKKNIYDLFLDGVKDGIKMSISLFPSVLAMILGIHILVESHFLMDLLSILTPILNWIHFPSEVLPLAMMRPVSGSASLAILTDLLTQYGPDSYLGRLASVMQGSTDTTIYILGLYFGSIGIRKTKYALVVGLLSDLCSMILSVLLVNLFFT